MTSSASSAAPPSSGISSSPTGRVTPPRAPRTEASGTGARGAAVSLQPEPARRCPGPGRRVWPPPSVAPGTTPSCSLPSTTTADVHGLGAAGLVRLGRSVALPANGSVAPVALGPGAARASRARRARRRVRRLAPARAVGPGPRLRLSGGVWAAQGGDVPPGRDSPSPTAARSRGARHGAGVWRRAVRCRRGARHGPATRWVGPTRSSATASTSSVSPRPPRRPTRGPPCCSWGATKSARGSVSCSRRPIGSSTPSPLTVWVAGEGPDTEWLRRRHPPSERIVWLGRIDDVELASRLAGAHALCAPALRGESFGVVLLEAMAARAAVVASDLPGYAAVVAGPRRARAPRRRGRTGLGSSRRWRATPPGARGCAPRARSTPPSATPRSGRCPRWRSATSPSTSGCCPRAGWRADREPRGPSPGPYTSRPMADTPPSSGSSGGRRRSRPRRPSSGGSGNGSRSGGGSGSAGDAGAGSGAGRNPGGGRPGSGANAGGGRPGSGSRGTGGAVVPAVAVADAAARAEARGEVRAAANRVAAAAAANRVAAAAAGAEAAPGHTTAGGTAPGADRRGAEQVATGPGRPRSRPSRPKRWWFPFHREREETPESSITTAAGRC